MRSWAAKASWKTSYQMSSWPEGVCRISMPHDLMRARKSERVQPKGAKRAARSWSRMTRSPGPREMPVSVVDMWITCA